MKKNLIIIFSIFCVLFLFTKDVLAEEQTADMSEWKFIQIISNDTVTISKLYSSKDDTKYGFCLEPQQHFNKKGDYYKNSFDDEYIFNLVKAYDQYGLDIDNSQSEESEKYNYYCATQILIWQYLTGEEYVFDKDYSEYIDGLLNYLDTSNNVPLLMSATYEDEQIYESKVDEEVKLEEDYSKYNVIADEGVEILSNEENNFTYKIISSEPEQKSIELDPIYNPKDYAFTYTSTDWQDIYCFEGTYEEPKPKFLSLMVLPNEPEYVDVYFSKKDENGNNIKGAKFTVYELNNDNYDEEVLFIQNDKQINLFETILGDYSNISNISIQINERYQKYLYEPYIKTNEIGYFDYSIYSNEELIKQGRCYVSDDINQTSDSYLKQNLLNVYETYSNGEDVNVIPQLETNKTYYVCESEPAKGYEYVHNACKLVDSSTYDGQTLGFVNSSRTYTLKLMKQSPYEVLLDGAKFKITYLDNNEYVDVYLTTGCLNIERQENNQYLIYQKEDDRDAKVIEFSDNCYTNDQLPEGKYYYYQSNDPTINYELLNEDYTIVTKGGICIENMPYSSSLTIEEIQAPEGFMITEPIFYLQPDISYSEITFRNFRVNEFQILPKKKIRIPKTCIDE